MATSHHALQTHLHAKTELNAHRAWIMLMLSNAARAESRSLNPQPFPAVPAFSTLHALPTPQGVPALLDALTASPTRHAIRDAPVVRAIPVPALHLSRVGHSHLPHRRPHVGLPVEADVDKQIAKLDSRPQSASQLEHAVATPKPSQHSRLVRDHLPLVADADVQKDTVGISGDTVDRLTECRVQPIGHGGRSDVLGFELPRQRQLVADRAHSSDGMQRDRNSRVARI